RIKSTIRDKFGLSEWDSALVRVSAAEAGLRGIVGKKREPGFSFIRDKGFPIMTLMHLLMESLFSLFDWTPGVLPGD
ncbi:hypothetical protein STEG23_018008, partial [Scotinomys teguina]